MKLDAIIAVLSGSSNSSRRVRVSFIVGDMTDGGVVGDVLCPC